MEEKLKAAEEILRYASYALNEMKGLVRAIDENPTNNSEYIIANKAEQKICDYLKELKTNPPC